MANCTQCGTPANTGDKFCGKCGHQFAGPNTHRDSQDRRHGRHHHQHQHARPAAALPALQTPSGMARFDEIWANRRSHAKNVRVACLVLSALGFVAAFIAYQAHSDAAMPFGVVSFIILAVAAGAGAGEYMKEADYYSIPGSRDESGNHRCIRCGSRGIFHKGQYKTNNKYANCSKSSCGEPLFSH